MMKVYRVGGAVRDALLGFPFSETDWVVVGSTPEALLAEGYTQVGKDFPVFLHPETKEEYALARTERKSGQGYHGFVVHADPSVTLEEDLARRDLTINAMAQDANDTIIDPYGGQADLATKTLRHVSEHFVEDPLRVLRVARFAARYAHLGFSIAPETLELMRTTAMSGELAHLSIERVWVESERALAEQNPGTYFQVLQDCHALEQWLPELVVTSGIDRLKHSAEHTHSSPCRWASLLSELPSERAIDCSTRIKAPNHYRHLAEKLCHWRPLAKAALSDADRCLELLRGLDALRRDTLFEDFLEVLAALEGTRANAHPSCQLLRTACSAAQSVKASDYADTGLTGPALGEAIRSGQVDAIGAVLGR